MIWGMRVQRPPEARGYLQDSLHLILIFGQVCYCPCLNTTLASKLVATPNHNQGMGMWHVHIKHRVTVNTLPLDT